MGRKGNWFSSVKKAFSPDSKKNQKSSKSQKIWLENEKNVASNSTSVEAVTLPLPPSVPQPKEAKLTVEENEQIMHDNSVTVACSAAAEAALAATRAAKEVVRATNVTRFAGKSKEEVAAIKIQTAFRGYLSRRALRALRGLVRLKSLMEGPTVKRQASHTLRCMQTLSRVQSQIHSRRIRMAEEKQALQKQLLQKHARELENLQMGEEWDDSLQSKEQIEAKLLNKYEAAMRRERALAYAFTHQQTLKNSSKSVSLTFTDPSNPTWGWSWLERLMAARPCDKKGMTEKELHNDASSMKSAGHSIIGGEISRAYARYQLNSDKFCPIGSQKLSHLTNGQSPSTPFEPNTVGRRPRPASPRVQDDDARSMASVKSYRRHSIGGSSVRDDESLAGSPGLPSYMVPTESARAKLKPQSPLVPESNGAEKGSGGAAKKRLSFPPTPGRPRRHSGPTKVDSRVNAENGVSNGGDQPTMKESD